jgi:hypothetical protein
MKLQLDELEVNSLILDSKADIELRKECSTETCLGSGCDSCKTLRGAGCLTKTNNDE